MFDASTSLQVPAADSGANTWADRAARFEQAAAQAAPQWFDESGRWLGPGGADHFDLRIAIWWTFALFAQEREDLANAMLVRLRNERWGDHHFNIFLTNIAVLLLVERDEQMTPAVRDLLTSWTRDGLRLYGGNRAPDYQFHGYNDNMPAKATMGLILGGERLHDAAAVDHGLWNLERLSAMLSRRGVNSEYNSPTYTPLTLHALSAIAHHARHPDARAMALQIEQRLWLDLAARFHPGLGVMAGPYSRAYTVDLIAGLSGAAMLLWLVLGDGVQPSPMSLFDPQSRVLFHHGGDRAFNIAVGCWLMSGHYHPRPQAMELLQQKQYPCTVVASSEQGDTGRELPARVARIETFLDTNFAIGTATTPFVGGEQTACYHAIWREFDAWGSPRVGTAHHKLVIDADNPGHMDGEISHDERFLCEDDNLRHRAYTTTLQAGTTVLALSHPHLTLGGDDDDDMAGAQQPRAISSLRDLFVFSAHFARHDALWINGVRCESWDGEVPTNAWIVIRRGSFVLGVRPMAVNVKLPPPRVRLKENAGYQWIETVLYEGQPRTFSRGELRLIGSGFIAEHAWIDHERDVNDFVQRCQSSRTEDVFWFNRRVHYRQGGESGVDLEMVWSPRGTQAMYATINGRLVESPAWQAQIGQTSIVAPPFAARPNRFFLPWSHFDSPWMKLPGSIGSYAGVDSHASSSRSNENSSEPFGGLDP